MEAKKEIKSLHFSISEDWGQQFTDMVRQISWWECNRDKAILMLLRSQKGMNVGQAESIIDGHHKLVTVDCVQCIVSMVEDDWQPPLDQIEDANNFIKETFVYIGFGCKKKTILGYWYDNIPEETLIELHREARRIDEKRNQNIWDAWESAKSLRQWAEEVMEENSRKRKIDGDHLKSMMESSDIFSGGEGVLDMLKKDVQRKIAQSDMPQDMKERMIRTAEGQIGALKGEIGIHPDPEFEYDTGWLSPEGNYYSCEIGQHIALGDQLARRFIDIDIKDGEQELENAHWVKCTGKRWYFASDRQLTRNQVDAIERWAKKWSENGMIKWNGATVPAINVIMHKGQNVSW